MKSHPNTDFWKPTDRNIWWESFGLKLMVYLTGYNQTIWLLYSNYIDCVDLVFSDADQAEGRHRDNPGKT